MKKELGKWMMDVAKYMTTALLLSSAFSNMENPWIVIFVMLSAVATLSGRLWLIKEKKKEV